MPLQSKKNLFLQLTEHIFNTTGMFTCSTKWTDKLTEQYPQFFQHSAAFLTELVIKYCNVVKHWFYPVTKSILSAQSL